MTSAEIRKRFLEYFEERGHKVVPSSSLVSDDPSVLLTTAGMQQFKPYFTGEKNAERDFGNKNVVSIQKCFRTSDIDEVGDESHLTFFEMLGNFSFGGYWKEEAIRYAHEFITKELGLAIDYVTVFDPDKVPAGDWRKGVPPDLESRAIWEKLGVRDIRGDGTDVFWGPTGETGPCGPTTEIYVGGIEVWNIVFNEFYADTEKKLAPLKVRGIDTGMGLERLAMVVQGKQNVFETDLFEPVMKQLFAKLPERTRRIISDHSRGVVFLIADGVRPSNKESGYVLRRLLRRIIAYAYEENIQTPPEHILESVVSQYRVFSDYKNLDFASIKAVYDDEYARFIKSVGSGLKELKKYFDESGKRYIGEHTIGRNYINIAETMFAVFQSYGLPPDVSLDEFEHRFNMFLDRDAVQRHFEEIFRKHQEISRAGAGKKFGGHGLTAEAEGDAVKLHTATHLLHQALRDVLGDEVRQEGSDITSERARFDFRFERKLTGDEKKQVEAIVNEKIRADLPVNHVELPKEEAEKTGALHYFKEKYPDVVSVYYVGNSLEDAYSKEFCGGPHVTHTGEIGTFKIVKEESVSAGVRRIRAVVE